MASSATTNKGNTNKSSTKNGLALVWLDDSSGEDPDAKAMFLTLFEQVYLFTDTAACLELVESAESETPCISILVSGKYGQMLVPDRFQPLNQVKDIYVYCFDIAKHNQWAQKCDKVRCVDSDFNKILKRMQQDLNKNVKQKQQPMEDQPEDQPQEEEELVIQEPERFTDDNNLYDQLALDLILRNADDNDGIEDFMKYCQAYKENTNTQEVEEQIKSFKPDVSIKEWYKQNLFFVQLNSTDFTQLWTLRWFIRIFYRQLTNEYDNLIKNQTNITVNYGTWLSTDELDGMKHRIGKIIIFTEFLMTYTNRNKALDSMENKKDEETKYKVIFEINVDTNIRPTVPYGEIQNDEVLFWFGSRYRLMKIELIEGKDNQDSYWLIGLNLCSTFDTKQSIQTLYDYYSKILTNLNDIHHAFGRILMYKGLYYQAEKWLQTNNHYEELAELAIRQYQLEQANQYLEHLPEDSHDANLLRAYVYLLTSSDSIAKGRTILMKICSEATDRIIRARANIALGFINLIVTQQIDQALDYFTLGNEAFCKNLPDIHPDIAKSFIGIGYTYFAQKNINEAEKAFQIAFKIQKQSLIYNHPDFAKTRNGLAHCLSIEKRTIKQALQEFEYAFNILIQTFSREYKTHPEILLTKNDTERLRKGKELRARNTLLDYI
jgi:tetratricopeptide (TPR) repeat protein